MSYRTVTIQTLLDRVRFHLLGPGVTNTSLDTEIRFALNSRVQDLIVRTDYAAFRVDGRLSLVAGVKDYQMPDDMSRLIEPSVKFSESPNWTLALYDQQDYDRLSGDGVFSSTARPCRYTLRGRDVNTGSYIMRFLPTPDTNYAVQFAYFAMPKDIVGAASTDVLDRRFPVQFHEALVYGATLMFPQYLGPAQTQMMASAYERASTEMLAFARPVVGRTHQARPYTGRASTETSTFSLSGTDLINGAGEAVT